MGEGCLKYEEGVQTLVKLLEDDEIPRNDFHEKSSKGEKERALFCNVLQLGCYLCTNQLCEARFLWLRHHDSEVFKGLSLSGEFKQMWSVGAELYRNKYVPVEGGQTPFSIIKGFKWSKRGQSVMSSFIEVYRRNT